MSCQLRRVTDTRQMTRLKRATEILVLFVLFPIALFMIVTIAIAVSLIGLVAYVGGLLAAWLLFAYAFPLATGIITPDEIVSAFKSQRGRRFEGEPLPEDRLLWVPWKPDQSGEPSQNGRRPSQSDSSSALGENVAQLVDS
jgi:hypothetical protein